MKKYILIITLSAINIMCLNAQSLNQSDINTTCFVLSELMTEAKEKGDYESLLIYINTINKIKKKYKIHEAYSSYFDSIKISNPNLNNGILISLNNPPKNPGFTNREIDDFLYLKKDGISLSDFNDFLVLKKLGQSKIKLESLNELQLKNINEFKKEIELIKINN